MSIRALETALRSAVAATAADAGWVARQVDGMVEVCAYAGPDEPARWLGARFPIGDAGTAGLAMSTGQPLAVRPRPGDALLAAGPMSLLGREPGCYASIPCATENATVGVVELVDKRERASFDFDDIELVSLLSDIIGALIDDPATGGRVDDPAVRRFAAAPDHVRAAVVALLDTLGAPG